MLWIWLVAVGVGCTLVRVGCERASASINPSIRPSAVNHTTLSPPAPPVLQVTLLRRLFKAALGDEAAKLVDINTIDGFQVTF